MKSAPPCLIALILALLNSSPGAEPVQPNVVVDLQVISLPRPAATPLIRALLAEKQAAGALEKLDALVATGEAQLVGWPMVITRSGQRARMENIRELRYPTAFDPGTIETHLEALAAGAKPPADLPVVFLAPVPTNFDFRSTGLTLEVEPVLEPDGRLISLNIVQDHVILRGWHSHTISRPGEAGAKQIEVTVDQPDFENLKASTSVQLKSGERVLLGTYQLTEPADHVELFILHVETREP